MIRTDRTKRVKEARDEAKKEIDAYRKQKDDEFKKFEAEVCYFILFDYTSWWVA
jgi:V-type H+-transporting ATPase subunit G